MSPRDPSTANRARGASRPASLDRTIAAGGDRGGVRSSTGCHSPTLRRRARLVSNMHRSCLLTRMDARGRAVDVPSAPSPHPLMCLVLAHVTHHVALAFLRPRERTEAHFFDLHDSRSVGIEKTPGIRLLPS